MTLSKFVKRLLVSVVALLVLFVLILTYLKNYRLEYCQTKYSAGTRLREWCLEDPLTKFIFER